MKFPAWWTRRRRALLVSVLWLFCIFLLFLEGILLPALLLGWFLPPLSTGQILLWALWNFAISFWLTLRVFKPWLKKVSRWRLWMIRAAERPLDSAQEYEAFWVEEQFEDRLREIYGEAPMVFSTRTKEGRVVVWSKYEEEIKAKRRRRAAHKERGFE